MLQQHSGAETFGAAIPDDDQRLFFRLGSGIQSSLWNIEKQRKERIRQRQEEERISDGRSIRRQRRRKEQWKNSGAAQHARTCPHGPNFGEVETVTVEHRKFERGVRESLEIQRHRSAPKFGGINLDDGQFLNNTFWMPFMDFITKEETERRNRRQMSSLTSNRNLSEDNA